MEIFGARFLREFIELAQLIVWIWARFAFSSARAHVRRCSPFFFCRSENYFCQAFKILGPKQQYSKRPFFCIMEQSLFAV